MLKRQTIDKLKKYLNHFPALAILGPRQVGKTTLAKMLISEIKRDTIYLDLELPSDLNKIENAELYFDYNQDKFIVIDEVQRKLELLPLLRAIIDQKRDNGRFLLLGSASPELLKKSSETLAGRIVYTELMPFNFNEVKNKFTYIQHWLRGGFPEPLLINEDDIRKEWFRSFVKTYIERDLPQLGLKTSSSVLNRLISMIAYNQGGILNISNFSRSIGVSVPSIITYLEYLENSYIIRRLKPFFINIKKRLKKAPKLYLTDTGILHYLTDIKTFEQLSSNVIIGNSWESYVIEQIISVTDNNYDYYYYRTQEGTECDLVLVSNQIPIAAIEIKYTSKPDKTKSFTIAINDLGTKNNFIIIPKCESAYPLSENIMVFGLSGFIDKIITTGF